MEIRYFPSVPLVSGLERFHSFNEHVSLAGHLSNKDTLSCINSKFLMNMFPQQTISSLLLQLLDFLSDSDEGTAEDVLAFVREAIQQYPRLKGNVVGRLLDVFGIIKSVRCVLGAINLRHCGVSGV